VAGALVAGAVPPFTADVASAHAYCDFVTGGGFILLPSDSGSVHGNFGVAGGCKNGSGTGSPPIPYWGHLNYLDHGSTLKPPTAPTPFHVHWTSITAYIMEDTEGSTKDPKRTGTRDICGTATTNDPTHQSVFFHVIVRDNGEPGVNDTFSISLKDAVTMSIFYATGEQQLGGGGPGGGNIQLHKPNPSTTGSDGGNCNGV
jgi:hypothetical protein